MVTVLPAIDVKHATLRVAVHSQMVRARAADGDIFVDVLKLAAGQRDRAGEADGVNRVAVICDNERVAQ